ncbi:MAG: MarR family transcriptional regulator [Muribaculaceae bacterium]
METLCKIRDIYRSIIQYEVEFQKKYNLCLNEGMLLCTLSKAGQLSSGEIAEQLGLTTSNSSKVILSVEKKGYISRALGQVDKRQMYFSLTKEGKKRLAEIKCNTIELPAELKQIVE